MAPLDQAAEIYLVVDDGPCACSPVLITNRTTIGRSSNCTLTLSSQLVSRVHAEITTHDATLLLKDLNSINGTYVNDHRISEANIVHGDHIAIGDFRLLVHAGSLATVASTNSDVVMYSSSEDTESRISIHGDSGALHEASIGEDAARAERASLRLETLVNVTQRLARLHEFDILEPLIVDEVMRILPAERVVLFRVDKNHELQVRAARNSARPGAQVEVSRTILDEVCSKRLCILSADATLDEAIGVSDSIMFQNIRSVLAVPIEYDDILLGALYLDAPGLLDLFSEEDLHFVSGLAGISAVAIKNAAALETVRTTGQKLNRTYLSMLAVLANAIEARDHYTVGHTWRVARFAQAVARRLGWPEDKLSEIEVGGLLHDIGKIGVSDSILSKTGPLNEAEKELMKLHPKIGARMLHDVPALSAVIPYILHHHENYDGTGYPDQLRGEAIPIEARLLAVADAFDAMTSTRPYRPGMDVEIAIGRLQRSSRVQFDPIIVEALTGAWSAGDLNQYLVAFQRAAHEVMCPHCSTYLTPPKNVIDESTGACPTCKRHLRFVESGDAISAELA